MIEIYEKLIVLKLNLEDGLSYSQDHLQEWQNKLTENDNSFLERIQTFLLKFHGSPDVDWFNAAEQFYNTLFVLKIFLPQDKGKLFLQELTNNLFSPTSQLKTSITDLHFSHIFFVIGHYTVKLLIYFDCLEDKIKASSSQIYQN